MKITKLTIISYLGIGQFKSTKLGKLNIITGGNGVGKSAILKAIKEAFKSSGKDPDVIKIGSDRAEIAVELDENVLIERNITPGTNRVKVIVEGQPLNSPQKWLSRLIGPFNFDPTAFCLAKQKEQRELLLSAIDFRLKPDELMQLIWPDGDSDMSGVFINWDAVNFNQHGLEALAQVQEQVYERRHEQNLSVTRFKKAIEQDKQDLPDTLKKDRFRGFDFDAKLEQLQRDTSIITQHQADIDKRGRLRRRGNELISEIDRLKQELARAETELAEVKTEGIALTEQIDHFSPPDIDSLKREIAEYREFQKLINRLEDIERREKELEKETEIHAAMDALYKRLTGDVPRKLMARIKLPIDNLDIQGDAILIDGVPLDKMATSEQMKFAIRIAKSLAGKLKAICVDRYESLDLESRAEVEKEAAQDDFEYFMTSVTTGPLNMESLDPAASSGKPEKEPVKTEKRGPVGF